MGKKRDLNDLERGERASEGFPEKWSWKGNHPGRQETVDGQSKNWVFGFFFLFFLLNDMAHVTSTIPTVTGPWLEALQRDVLRLRSVCALPRHRRAGPPHSLAHPDKVTVIWRRSVWGVGVGCPQGSARHRSTKRAQSSPPSACLLIPPVRATLKLYRVPLNGSPLVHRLVQITYLMLVKSNWYLYILDSLQFQTASFRLLPLSGHSLYRTNRV